MKLYDSDRAWKWYGEGDPYFGVLTQPRYHLDELSDSGLSEFFASGQEHVDEVLQTARDRVDAPHAYGTVLDFGCGVGRLAVPFAKHADRVVGVDVAPGMLAEARKNADRFGVDNLDLVSTEEWLGRVGERYDLAHTYIVLQHMSVNRGLTIIDAMLDRLAPEGVGVIHVTYSQRRLRTRLNYWLRHRVPFAQVVINALRGRALDTPAMQMNRYDLNVVLARLQEKGVEHSHVRFTDHGGHYGVSLYFRKPAGAASRRAA